MNDLKTYNITYEDAKASTIIQGTIPYDEVKKIYDTIVAQEVEHANIEGFRKGKAPKETVIKKIGDATLLEKAANEVVYNIVPLAIAEKKITPIGMPITTYPTLEHNKPISFNARVYILPSFTTPDYTSIAKNIPEESPRAIEDKDVDAAFTFLLAQLRKKKPEEITDTTPTDEEMKSLQCSTIEECRKKVEESLQEEQKTLTFQRRRSRIAEALAVSVVCDIPDILIAGELDNMIAEFKNDITRFGSTFEEYTKKSNKTENDLRTAWRENAQKRVILHLIVAHIAKAEKIQVSDEEIKPHFETLKKQHPKVKEDDVKRSVAASIINNKVFELLESLK